MNTIIFWGAGKTGKRMLDLWRQFGAQPDFFADNSLKLCGTLYCGIRVLSIEELCAMERVQILITCSQVNHVSAQLLEHGINQKDIFKGNTENDMLSFLTFHMIGRLNIDVLSKKSYKGERNRAFSVLFDVQYGFVLGGVEAWVRQSADELLEQNIKVKFITTDIKGWDYQKNDDKIIHLKYQKDEAEINKLIKCLKIGRAHV